MVARASRAVPVLGLALFAACAYGEAPYRYGGDGGGDQGAGGAGLTLVGAPGAAAAFDVEPRALQSVTVAAGATTPTVTYTATLDGLPVSVGWGVDEGNVGTVSPGPASSAVFAPTGTAGGLVTVSAGLEGRTVQRQVRVLLTAQQNGATAGEQGQVPASVAQLTAGGGVGGVGGGARRRRHRSGYPRRARRPRRRRRRAGPHLPLSL